MSLFQSHPGVLGDQYKENILAVCDPAFQDQDDLTRAVDRSYEVCYPARVAYELSEVVSPC